MVTLRPPDVEPWAAGARPTRPLEQSCATCSWWRGVPSIEQDDISTGKCDVPLPPWAIEKLPREYREAHPPQNHGARCQAHDLRKPPPQTINEVRA